MPEKYDEPTAFQDFLEMELDRFTLKYRDETQIVGNDGKKLSNLRVKQILRSFKRNPPLLDRKSPGVSHKRKYRQRNPDGQEKLVKEIETQFKAKGITADGISSYVSKLREVGTKSSDVSPAHFLYNGTPLTLTRLKNQKIDGERLSHKTNVTQELLMETIQDLEKLIPGNSNLAALRYYAETNEDKETPTEAADDKVEYLPDLAIGSFDLELSKRREEIYAFWKERYKIMKTVLDISKEIIDEYDKNNKHYAMLDDDMGREDSDKSFRRAYEKLNGSGAEGEGDDWVHPNNYIMAIEAKSVKVSELNNGRVHELVRLWFDEIKSTRRGITGGADWGKDSENAASLTGWTEGDTLEEIDQLTPEGSETQLVEDITQMERDAQKEEGQWKHLLSDEIWVDPLLYYLIENTKLKLGAFTRLELKDAERHLQRRVRKIKRWVREYHDDENVIDGLSDYVNKIKDRASDAEEGELYYLPVSKPLIPLKLHKRMNNSVLKLHSDYLISLDKMLTSDDESKRFRAPQYQIGSRTTERSGGHPAATFPEPYGVTGIEGTVGELKETDEQTKMPGLFNKLIEAIEDYYLDPIGGQYYPFEKGGSDTIFADFQIMNLKNTLEANWKPKGKKGTWKGTAVMAKAWADSGTDLVTLSELKEINNYLLSQKQYDGNNFSLLYEKAIDAYYALESVTSKQLTRLNKIWFAYHLDLLARKNGNNIKGHKFIGEFISELKDEYKDSIEDYPMKALQTTIESKWDSFIGEGPHSKPIDKKKVKEIREYGKTTRVTKSYVETEVLNAHDTIRKMLGKPTYYAFSNINDFDDVNNTINIIKKANNVELMPIEIENIVGEFDSHKELSKKYGLSEDIIYRIKAMYR